MRDSINDLSFLFAHFLRHMNPQEKIKKKLAFDLKPPTTSNKKPSKHVIID